MVFAIVLIIMFSIGAMTAPRSCLFALCLFGAVCALFTIMLLASGGVHV